MLTQSLLKAVLKRDEGNPDDRNAVPDGKIAVPDVGEAVPDSDDPVPDTPNARPNSNNGMTKPLELDNSSPERCSPSEISPSAAVNSQAHVLEPQETYQVSIASAERMRARRLLQIGIRRRAFVQFPPVRSLAT